MNSKFKLVFFLFALLIILGISIFYTFRRLPKNDGSELRTAFFLDSTPNHNENYAAQPINITANFKTDLTNESDLSVLNLRTKEGWAEGKSSIENNNTALKKTLRLGMPDGKYKVSYKACSKDVCEEGVFYFSIDSSKKSEFQDLRGKSEVRVNMKDLKFSPEKIIVSPNTKITWVNVESPIHFVNTETHPAHTYFKEQNSRGIAENQTYSTTFVKAGQYNYHCSAHVPEKMFGSIIVSN